MESYGKPQKAYVYNENEAINEFEIKWFDCLFSGQSPAEADYNLLETARRCEMYGIKLTAVKDHEGVPLNLSVAHLGVIVFQNQTKVNTFSWAKIRKLSFKRKRFLIKLHQEVNHH